MSWKKTIKKWSPNKILSSKQKQCLWTRWRDLRHHFERNKTYCKNAKKIRRALHFSTHQHCRVRSYLKIASTCFEFIKKTTAWLFRVSLLCKNFVTKDMFWKSLLNEQRRDASDLDQECSWQHGRSYVFPLNPDVLLGLIPLKPFKTEIMVTLGLVSVEL